MGPWILILILILQEEEMETEAGLQAEFEGGGYLRQASRRPRTKPKESTPR